ncbi:MAG: protein translocase subunit SecD [Actinomycetota bacterium]
MRRSRSLWVSVLFIAVLVGGAVTAFATGTRPVLGLDLEGGVSVVLTAPEGTPKEVMERALENIRNRIDAVGVAEPQLFVTGNNIEVELPGLARGTIEERTKHQFCLIGGDDESLGCFAAEAEADGTLAATSVQDVVTQACLIDGDGEPLSCFGDERAADAALKAVRVEKDGDRFCLTSARAATAESGNFGCFDTKDEAKAALEAIVTESTHTFCVVGEADQPLQGGRACYDTDQEADGILAALAVQEKDLIFCVISSSQRNLGCFLSSDAAQARLQETGQERLLQVIGTTARLEQREVLATLVPGDPEYQIAPVTCPSDQPHEEGCSFNDLADQPVVFLGNDGTTKYRLGPVEITGDAIRKATAVLQTATNQSFQSGWQIDFQLTSEGSDIFGEVTTRLVNRQLAIVVDQTVISAPTVQSAITGGSGVIEGSFSEREAKDLATQLNAGALPVNLTKNQVVTVSPTLGRESLHQGLIAGIVGLVALALYLAFYYRLLGIVTWLGMTIWAVLALALVSLLGRTAGYSLTLAGVAGLIVALGITADSYIVFYERLKDEVRNGKTPRAAIQPAFRRAFRTILTADFVTFLAAGILYLVAVSSVRGFALTLGLATVLDVFVVYFFKRPTVFLIARSNRLQNLRGFGLASGVAADPVPVAGGSR